MKRCRISLAHQPGGLAILLVVAVLLLAACTGARGPADPPLAPPSLHPVPTLFPTIAVPTTGTTGEAAVAGPPDSGWITAITGVELRKLRVQVRPERAPASVVVVRLDPGAVRLRVAYAPDQPRLLRSWFAGHHPLLAVNGGFFTAEYHSTALVISDGVASGSSYEGFGGMLAVGPEGNVALRALRDHPYDPAEPLDQAIQSFPMLVVASRVPAPITDDGARARRTAVAQDRDGRLLLIVSPTSSFTLRELAEWLAESDLDVERALNLDGGSSTGMYLSAGAIQEQIDSLGPLPMVLLVEAQT